MGRRAQGPEGAPVVSSPHVTATEAEAGGTKELRLGVVCYGGSSLAIYMHGVTKELHRLVKGSALLDAELEPAKDALSETLYRDLLRKLADEQDVTTRVVVDVVAGTSAGGINGIYLTKAIARNRSLDGLRDVWFEKGDMKELLLLPKRLPVKLRFFLLLPRAVRHSPLRGNEMAQWLFKALEEMDDATAEPAGLQTLVPEDGRIDLFVTITDFYGYERQVPISRPHLVHDLRHRHALTFSYGPAGRDQFQRANNGSMAFAARATSCFPGVFPPVSFKAFREWVPKAPLDDLVRCFRSHTLAGDGSGDLAVRRRRHPRQQTVRLGDRRDRQASRGRRGRSTPALRRARPRGARTSGAGQAEGRAGNDRRDSGRGQQHPAQRADPGRPARHGCAQRARAADPGRDRDELPRRDRVRHRRGRPGGRPSRGCGGREARAVEQDDQREDDRAKRA